MKKKVPVPLPSEQCLEEAYEALSAFQLHYYQLLYFNNPPLTQPGSGGAFHVDFNPKAFMTLKIICHANPEYNFIITPYTHESKDEEILNICHMILKAINEKKEKISPRACCPLAKWQHCVCFESFACPIHGSLCIGSHD